MRTLRIWNWTRVRFPAIKFAIVLSPFGTCANTCPYWKARSSERESQTTTHPASADKISVATNWPSPLVLNRSDNWSGQCVIFELYWKVSIGVAFKSGDNCGFGTLHCETRMWEDRDEIASQTQWKIVDFPSVRKQVTINVLLAHKANCLVFKCVTVISYLPWYYVTAGLFSW